MMFPRQPTYFGFPATSQSYQIKDSDLITDHAFLDNNLISFSIGSNDNGGESRKTAENRHDPSSSRRVMHREVERKRRLEISSLFASLRSLLPDDRIKGKRSVCDQIEEAASHIREIEKNIVELRSRRDKLKRCLFNSTRGNGGSEDLRDCVTVNMAGDGVEILISRSIKVSGIGLSRVFAELQERGLDVVSSASTRMKDRFIHKIHVKAREMKNLGGLELHLQERLAKAIKGYSM